MIKSSSLNSKVDADSKCIQIYGLSDRNGLDMRTFPCRGDVDMAALRLPRLAKSPFSGITYGSVD